MAGGKGRSGSGGKRPGSGRKKGVPNKATGEVKAVAQKFGIAALDQLAILAGLLKRKGRSPAESDTARIAALKEILDRGYGRPAQSIIGDEDHPIQVKTRVEFVIGDPKS